jgi:hypothetical protein
MGRLQMSAFSIRLEKTSRPVVATDGRMSSPDPMVRRWAGPVIRQLCGEIGICHKLTPSPAFAPKKTWSLIHSPGAGTRLGMVRLIFCAAKAANAWVLTGGPPASGHTHQSEVGYQTGR